MTDSNSTFNPDWRNAPGNTIRDIMIERGMSYQQFAELIDLPSLLLSGDIAITDAIAERLAVIFGNSRDFWINREAHYRAPIPAPKVERHPIDEALKDAEAGHRVLLVQHGVPPSSNSIGDKGGMLFVRDFKMSGLKSVSVDIVYLVGDVPESAANLARERCRGSAIGEVRVR